MTDVRALTLWQPHASLVAIKVKGIETRSWSTPYRGRLLIHAAAKPPDDAPLGDWRIGRSTLRYPDRTVRSYAYTLPGDGGVVPLPLGVVVASCRLDDVVPIGGPTSFSTGLVEGESPPTAGLDVIVNHGPEGPLMLDRWQGGVDDITDQRPFGDFDPDAGRWGWLLSDVQATTDRCPACWGERIMYPDADDPNGPVVCFVCEQSGVCEPVPMRGRQRLWHPRWAA